MKHHSSFLPFLTAISLLVPSLSFAQEAPGEAFYYSTAIPLGGLTRSQFIDAVATRLYDADTHDRCFADLILSDVNYTRLFRDVTLDTKNATSICLGMRGGLAQGYTNGNYGPNDMITAAEGAAILGDVGGYFLRDSNHVRRGEPWYERYMEALRNADREFTLQPGDIFTGRMLRQTLCNLKGRVRQYDPLNEC